MAIIAAGLPAAAVADPGTPATWGANGSGQLGDGTTSSQRTPAAIGLDDVIDLHAGREHVVALVDNGTVRTWGRNNQGQIGNGNRTNRLTPFTVPGLGSVVAVETGHYHSMALRSNGTIMAWGYNAFGQLGDGSSTRRTSPAQVTGVTDAVDIAAGRDMSYAIRGVNATVWAWGLNGDGQLGDGTSTNRSTPVRVGSLTDAVDIAGGRDHGLAVLANGQVWAWGWNRYGQLGDGTRVDRHTPVRVTGLGPASAVIAGAHHSYALLQDGTVWAWGRNYRAQLGDGSTSLRTRPVRVGSISNAVAIGSGRDHGLAVLSNGTVRAWGNNQGGQLGDGTLTRRTNPVAVPGLDDAQIVAGGSDYSVALVAAGGPPPPNQSPTADIDVTCAALTCQFDSGDSSDPDGQVESRSWTFGDGGESGAVAPTHSYGSPDTYTVSLTVTDDDGATDTATSSITVTEPTGETPTFRAAAATNANTINPRVTIPAQVQAGDQLVLFANMARPGAATTPSGWILLDTRQDDNLVARLYTRTATAGDAGTRLTIELSQRTKTDLSLVAYDNAADVAAWAGAVQPGSSASHTTPNVTVAADSTIVSHWVDRTSNATNWSLPGNVSQRVTSTGSGGGRVNSATGDTADAAPGTWPGVTATAANAASRAVTWSVVISGE